MNLFRGLRNKVRTLARMTVEPLVRTIAWLNEAWFTCITYWEGDRGHRYRLKYYRSRLGSLGKGCRIDVGVRIESAANVFLGNDVHIDRNSILCASSSDLDLSHRDLRSVPNPEADVPRGRLFIGNNCHIGQGTAIFAYGGVRIDDLVTLSAGTRIYSLSSLARSPTNPNKWCSLQPYEGSSPTIIGPIKIGRNAWLGLDCLVFPGVTVGEDVFARSRSVLTRSVPPNSWVSGDPAVVTQLRFDDDTQEK